MNSVGRTIVCHLLKLAREDESKADEEVVSFAYNRI